MRAETVEVIITPFPTGVGDVARLVTNCGWAASPFSSSSSDSSDSSSSEDEEDWILGGVGALGCGGATEGVAQDRLSFVVDPFDVDVLDGPKLTTGRLLLLLYAGVFGT